MKDCPFCKESIQDNAIICRYCGENIESTRLANIQRRKSGREFKKSATKYYVGAGLLLFSLIISLLLFGKNSIFSRTGFPIFPLIISILSLAIIIFSLFFNKIKYFKTYILAIFLPFLLMSTISFINNIEKYTKYLSEQKEFEIRYEKIEKELKYNQEHIDDLYLNGIRSLKEKKYEEAKNLFDRVCSVNPNYKDVKNQLKATKTIISNIEKRERLAKGKINLDQAIKYSKSNNCYEMNEAINICENIIETIPELRKGASECLLRAQLNSLSCPEGNGIISMAIRIEGYHPLTLYVWIKNKSSEVRYANPGYFTLVTVNNRSFSHSTETYGHYNYFTGVELQPGTETSGFIVFDTSEKPKQLIYKEMLGTSISREFPFD